MKYGYVKYECITQRGTSLASLAITKENIQTLELTKGGRGVNSCPDFLGKSSTREGGVYIIVSLNKLWEMLPFFLLLINMKTTVCSQIIFGLVQVGAEVVKFPPVLSRATRGEIIDQKRCQVKYVAHNLFFFLLLL